MIKSLVRRMVFLERNSKQSQGGSLARVQELALTMLSDSELEALTYQAIADNRGSLCAAAVFNVAHK